ncbi:MAG: phosphohistidine phosphatase SixA [Chlamydiales bacterium]|nr:phosphohistidine phosphatase SixA [Chlamydiales bacterium]
MKLYLVRHGDALPPDLDPSSPLSQKGVLETQRLAKTLSEFNLEIDIVYHSVKLRAKQTAEILFPNSNIIEKEGLKPNDTAEPIQQELEATAQNIALVSHLPFLENLVRLLRIQELRSFSFGNTEILALERTAIWHLCWCLNPKIFY